MVIFFYPFPKNILRRLPVQVHCRRQPLHLHAEQVATSMPHPPLTWPLPWLRGGTFGPWQFVTGTVVRAFRLNNFNNNNLNNLNTPINLNGYNNYNFGYRPVTSLSGYNGYNPLAGNLRPSIFYRGASLPGAQLLPKKATTTRAADAVA